MHSQNNKRLISINIQKEYNETHELQCGGKSAAQIKDIKEARENADVVIVFPHWGTENSFGISDYQKEYTELFSSLGVDLVIGCHPHVIQPVKEVTNDKGHKMLVYYSLGNFISHQIEIDQLCGGMASVDIEKKNGEITIEGKLVPIA